MYVTAAYLCVCNVGDAIQQLSDQEKDVLCVERMRTGCASLRTSIDLVVLLLLL